MSNHDYTKYSKNTEEEVDIKVFTDGNRVEDEPLMTATCAEEETDSDMITEPTPVVTGRVTNCKKLNVREEPSLNSEVLCEILNNSEVEIDEAESTDDFYKIVTVTGVEGFCKKEYIAISQ